GASGRREAAGAKPTSSKQKPTTAAKPAPKESHQTADAGRSPSSQVEFNLPNLGEGIAAATVTAVLVKPGDRVTAGQNLLTVETDKAAVDVPSESEGTVEAVLVKPGDKVAVGRPVLTLMASGRRAPAGPTPASSKKKATAPA